MSHKYSTFFKAINIIADFSVLNAAFLVCLFASSSAISFNWRHQLSLLLLNLCWFSFTSLVGFYTNVIKRPADDIAKTAVVALFMYWIVVSGIFVSFPHLTISFSFIVFFLLIFSTLLLAGKLLYLVFRKSRRKFWIEERRIVMLGAGPVGRELYHYFESNPYLGYQCEGIFDDSYCATSGDPNVRGKIDECLEFAKQYNIDEIYCALPSNESGRIRQLMRDADKAMIRMRVVPDLGDILIKNVMLEIYGQLPILASRDEPLENKTNEIVKRIFDVIFSLGVIVFILSWVVPLIGLIIKLESQGPIFFRQLRSGKNNKPFYCLKFRSMTVNAEADTQQATRGDKRVTRVGAFLRKYSIDELPQFINVLVGDMSVVGPRPHMLKHTEHFSSVIGNYMVRQFLTPGITGWAQVNGLRGEIQERVALKQRVDADLWYLENWSFFLDLKIVFLTIWQAIRKNENAY